MKDNKKHNNKFVVKTVIISAILMLILVLATIVGVNTWPNRTLNRIQRQIDKQNYQSAKEYITEYEKQFEDADLQEQKDECNYNIAKTAIAEGDTTDVRYLLKGLGSYPDVKDLLKECDYIDACSMMDAAEYEDAYTLFVTLGDYKDADEKILLARYEIAKETYDDGDRAKSFDMFRALNGYKDSHEKADKIAVEVTGANSIAEAYSILDGMNVEQMENIAYLTEAREALPANVLAVGAHHTVGLKYDGTVLAAGLNDDMQCDVSNWDNIIAVDAGALHTVGLKDDGTVLAVGNNEYGQCEVSEWSGVVKIAAGAYNTYGLLEDGTVLSTGYQGDVVFDDLTDIKQIGAGSYGAACVNKEGHVFTTHKSLLLSETGAIEVDVSTGYIIALMPNGSVTASIDKLSDWEDIIAVSASATVVLGVKADGSIRAYFFRQRDAVDLRGYNNVFAIAAGGAHSVIMLDDGSVAAFGEDDYGECQVSGWRLLDTAKE